MCEVAKVLPIYKALADETRLQILAMLSCGKRCACRINDAFECSQPTISYHMRVLTEAGLVSAKRDGALMCYELNEAIWDAMTVFRAAIETNEKEDAI